MKYKAGDIVKLRDDLEVDKFYKGIKFIYEMERLKHLPIELLKHEIFDNCYMVEDYNGKEYIVSEAMIERLWEECKSTEQVSKSEGEYKLIDILNKIANGELKEGTKVIRKEDIEGWGDLEYTYINGDLERKCCGETIYVYEEMFSRHLNEEVELIEPQEPTDNTKIEELKGNGRNGNFYTMHDWIVTIEDKLNEVIRYINKGAEE